MATKRRRKNRMPVDLGAKLTPVGKVASVAPIAVGVTGVGARYVDQLPLFPAGVAVVGAVGTLATYAVYKAHVAHGHPHHTVAAHVKMWGAWSAAVAIAIAAHPLGWAPWGFWAAAAAAAVLVVLSWMWLKNAALPDAAAWENRNELLTGDVEQRAAEVEMYNVREADRGLAIKWIGHIEKVLNFTPIVIGIRHWPEMGEVSPGFSLGLQLPRDGKASRSSFSDDAMDRLADVARLDNGCAVTAGKGERRGEVRLHVEMISPEKLVIEHPRDWSPLTVNGPLPVTLAPDSRELTVTLREQPVIIAAVPGTGKSNLLHAFIAAIARCPDALVFGADIGKKGAAYRPWTTGLPEGTKSVVPSVASTYSQALAQVEALQRIADDRVARYGAWMQANDTDMVPISASCPMIFWIVDEAAEVFGDAAAKTPADQVIQKKLAAATHTLLNTTRQAGIRPITTFVDANLDSIGNTTMLKGTVKIALVGNGKKANPETTQRLFPGLRGVNVDSLVARGRGLGDFDGGVSVFRAPRMSPSVSQECSIATSARRPSLPAEEVALLGSAATLPSVPLAEALAAGYVEGKPGTWGAKADESAKTVVEPGAWGTASDEAGVDTADPGSVQPSSAEEGSGVDPRFRALEPDA